MQSGKNHHDLEYAYTEFIAAAVAEILLFFTHLALLPRRKQQHNNAIK
jgi:hypothetical protein